ncbi:MAG: hypothetical protein PUB13_06545 [Lachnospiraceae bacterium]|nr:hypothetical protein [Lachnospiraceae bacterium]
MRIGKELWIKNRGFLAGIITVLMFYLFYGVISSYHSTPVGNILSAILAVAVAGGYLTCFYDVFCSKKDEILQKQLIKLNGFIGCLCVLYLIVIFRKNLYTNQKVLLFSFLLFVVVSLGICLVLLKKGYFMTGNRKERMKKWGVEHIFPGLLLIACIVLSIEESGICYRWDSGLYYTTVADMNLFSVGSLAAYGHIAQAFGMFTSLGVGVTGSVDMGILFANLFVFLAGVAAFYGILASLVPGKRPIAYTLATAVYAFSPFLLGMVDYISLDFFTQSLFAVVVYFMVKKEWILHFVAALLFCFTKEPAVAIYAFLCMGMVLYDFYKNRSIKKLFLEKKYYLMVLCGGLWLITYRIIGPWSAGNSSVGINMDYIIKKLKVLYCMNFNWIFTLLGIALFIMILCKKEKNHLLEAIFPLLTAQIGFTLFSCLFRTANHARYTDSSFFTLCIIGTLFVLSAFSFKLQVVTSSVLAALMLFSSFWTIDPVTRNIFPMIDVGQAQIATTGGRQVLGDESIYNRQMLYLEKPFSKAVKDSMEEDSCILLPSMEDNTLYLNGMDNFHTIKDYRKAQVIWDTKREKRVFYENEECALTSFYEMADDMSVSKMTDILADENVFSYIYMDSIGADRVSEIKENYTVQKEEEYSYRGFVIKRIQFERKHD